MERKLADELDPDSPPKEDAAEDGVDIENANFGL